MKRCELQLVQKRESRVVMNEKKLEKMKLDMLSGKIHNSLYIYERYPDVQEIEIAYKSESGSWEHAVKDGKRIFTPNDKAVFLIKCPNSTCTGIGFDLGHEVDRLYLNKEESLSGQMVCTEYEDAERYGKFRCGSSIDYVITIVYKR